MPSLRNATLIFVGLVIFMVATRFPGLGSNLHLQDASWAIFFIAGFYLRERWRSGFPALMAAAVAIDWVAIRYYGISNYCVTAAYGFLAPAYAALWLGGSWLRRHATADGRGLLALGGSAVVSASVSFLVSNGSFYWLGQRVTAPTFAGWSANLAAWYGPFVGVCLAYIAAVALAHWVVARLSHGAVPTRARPG